MLNNFIAVRLRMLFITSRVLLMARATNRKRGICLRGAKSRGPLLLQSVLLGQMPQNLCPILVEHSATGQSTGSNWHPSKLSENLLLTEVYNLQISRLAPLGYNIHTFGPKTGKIICTLRFFENIDKICDFLKLFKKDLDFLKDYCLKMQ